MRKNKFWAPFEDKEFFLSSQKLHRAEIFFQWDDGRGRNTLLLILSKRSLELTAVTGGLGFSEIFCLNFLIFLKNLDRFFIGLGLLPKPPIVLFEIREDMKKLDFYLETKEEIYGGATLFVEKPFFSHKWFSKND